MTAVNAPARTAARNVVDAHRRRFYALAAVFVVVQALTVLLSWAALEAVDIARAYVAGEGLYSKAHKGAVISLHHFAETGDPARFREFEESIAVVVGDRQAREALERPTPDFAAAREGFAQGNIQRADIDGMNLAFVMLNDWGPFAEAVADWRAADKLNSELVRVAAEIRASGFAGTNRKGLSELTARVDALDRLLTAREQSFTVHIRETTQRVRAFASLLLLLGSTLFVTAGLASVWRISRKGADGELRALVSEDRFRGFTDIASDWFLELDANLTIVYLSDRFEESTGVPASRVLGHAWVDATRHPSIRLEAPSHIDDMAARRPFRGHTMRHASAGGERYWSLSGRPVFDDTGAFQGYRATGTDITELVQANKALAGAKDLAEQANRSKSSFLANMSHELRTPLNAIIGFAETMTYEVFGALGNERYRSYAHDIHTSGRHLLSLINDVLDLSRIEAGKLELYDDRVCFADIVDGCVVVCRGRAESGSVSVTAVLPRPAPVVRADPVRLKQIVINLLSNAVKFTPPGGRVEIAAHIDERGALAVAVKDTGIGMAPEDVAVALQPFGQVDHGLNRKYEGTGLGLPLTKTLVELHGGTVEIDGTLGQGTTVRFTLPADRVQRTPVAAAAS